MSKKLTEMSLEELWKLFPIFLTNHQTCWANWYLEEKILLEKTIPHIERISHIGSTAIPTIWAKPIIDILIEIPKNKQLSSYIDLIVNAGYICMSKSKDKISFNKGYTEKGFAEKVFHLHLKYSGNNDELYFKDYLIEHPDIAKKYEKLKLELGEKYKHNRDAYTNAKAEFVKKYTDKAKSIYTGRY